MWQLFARASIPRAWPTTWTRSTSKELPSPVAHGKQVDEAPLKTKDLVSR